jgi:hypothetical protein
MTAPDPHIERLAVALCIETRDARSLVLRFCREALRWAPWTAPWELARMLEWAGPEDGLVDALLAARMIEPADAGWVIAPSMDAGIARAEQTRRAAKDRKRLSREAAQEGSVPDHQRDTNVTESADPDRDRRVTPRGNEWDKSVTDSAQRRDEGVTDTASFVRAGSSSSSADSPTVVAAPSARADWDPPQTDIEAARRVAEAMAIFNKGPAASRVTVDADEDRAFFEGLVREGMPSDNFRRARTVARANGASKFVYVRKLLEEDLMLLRSWTRSGGEWVATYGDASPEPATERIPVDFGRYHRQRSTR